MKALLNSKTLAREQADELEKAMADRNQQEHRTMHDLYTIEAAIGLHHKPFMPPKEIQKRTGINPNTLRGWARHAPFAAQRLAEHYQLAVEIGYPADHLLRWPLALNMGLNSIKQKERRRAQRMEK